MTSAGGLPSLADNFLMALVCAGVSPASVAASDIIAAVALVTAVFLVFDPPCSLCSPCSELEHETAECASGGGGRCKARRVATQDRRVEREVAEMMLRELPLEGRENGKLKRAAELISFFGGIDPATAEKGLALIWPFIQPLVCELLTIVFLHLGFAVSASVPVVPRSVPLAPANDPGPGSSCADGVVDWCREFQVRHGRKPMIPEVQREFRLPKTTAWRRIRAA